MTDGNNYEVDKIYNFLKKTHPKISDNNKIEIRALARDGTNKVNSYSITNYNETQKKALSQRLKELSDTPHCIYYSTYNYKHSKSINNTTSTYTNIIAVDLDYCNRKKKEMYINKLKQINIAPSIVIFTGNGYHFIWVLNKASHDKEILKKFNRLMLKNGYDVDPKVIDSARILRLPFTFNCKEFTQKENTQPKAKYTYITEENNNTYSVERIFKALGGDYNAVDTKDAVDAKTTAKEEAYNNYDNSYLKAIYSDTKLNIDVMQEPIKAVLMGFRNGKTDAQIGALVPYLKNQGLTKEEVFNILQIMARNNKYNYAGNVLTDLERKASALFEKDYKTNWEAIKEFGTPIKFTKGQSIKMDNEILSCAYSNKLSSQAYVLYLRLQLNAHYKTQYSYTTSEITKLSKRAEKATRKNVKELIDAKIIDKKRGKKKKGEENTYILSKFKKAGTKGYTQIPAVVLDMLLIQLDQKILTETIVRFIIYIHWQSAYNSVISQQAIAEHLNIKRNTVAMMWKRLEEDKRIPRYVTREQEWLSNNKYTYNYISHLLG